MIELVNCPEISKKYELIKKSLEISKEKRKNVCVQEFKKDKLIKEKKKMC